MYICVCVFARVCVCVCNPPSSVVSVSSKVRLLRHRGDAHSCHALYLAGELSAAAAPAEPREASGDEEWHAAEWPLFAPPAQTDGSACAVL